MADEAGGANGFLSDHVGSSDAAHDVLLATLRALAETYHSFSAYSAAHVRQLGLTPAQFDVIATLGNTPGMPLSQLARKTLVTKGTLTGIIDRLEAKGLVERKVPSTDRRSFCAILTTAGEELFASVFPVHIEHIEQCFRDMPMEDLKGIQHALRLLRGRFGSDHD